MDEPGDVRCFGRLKCYYPLKGYGFIEREKGKDVFFFRTDAADEHSLEAGALLSFFLVDTGKGPRAVSVARVG